MALHLHLHLDCEWNRWTLQYGTDHAVPLCHYYAQTDQTHPSFIKILLTAQWNSKQRVPTTEKDKPDQGDMDGFTRLLHDYNPYRIDIDADAFIHRHIPSWMTRILLQEQKLQNLKTVTCRGRFLPPSFDEPTIAIPCLRLENTLSSGLCPSTACQYLHLHAVPASQLHMLARWIRESTASVGLRCLSVRALNDIVDYSTTIAAVWNALESKPTPFHDLEYLEMETAFDVESQVGALRNCPNLIALRLFQEEAGASLNRILTMCRLARLERLSMVMFTTNLSPLYDFAQYFMGDLDNNVSVLASDLFSPGKLLSSLTKHKHNFYEHSILEYIKPKEWRMNCLFQEHMKSKRTYLRQWKQLCFWIAWCRPSANGTHIFCNSGLPLAKMIHELSAPLHSCHSLLFPTPPFFSEKSKKRKNLT